MRLFLDFVDAECLGRKGKVNLVFSFRHQPADPRKLFTGESDARLWFLTPDFYQELLTKYREFKSKK